MGVDIIWNDAEGNQLDAAFDPGAWFAWALNKAQNPPRHDLPLMLTIDVYGDTILMPPQTDALASELERFRAEIDDPEARAELSRFLTIIRAAGSRSGSTLEFRGD